MKKVLILLAVAVTLVVCFVALKTYLSTQTEVPGPKESEYKNVEFLIDGQRMKLGSTLRYFGNELAVDLNADGKDDTVFLVTHTPGGSGTFFYVVAVITTGTGYVGSDGYLLGDRIAPQTTELSQETQHENVVVINYADRALSEPMTMSPSFAKSVFLKLDVDTMQWGIVEAGFLGEANPQSMSLDMKTWVWQSVAYNDGTEIVPTQKDAFTLTFKDQTTFSVTTDCNSAGGTYQVSENTIRFSDIFSTLMYCEDSQEAVFLKLLENTTLYHFTTKGELILDLAFDSGTATLR